jgi:predicted dehydrogenase
MRQDLKHYLSLEDVAEDPDVDLVDLTLPIEIMPDAIRLFLSAGKHVISENPGAPSVATGVELMEHHARPERPVIWAVAENWRFKKTTQMVEDIVASGERDLAQRERAVRRSKASFIRPRLSPVEPQRRFAEREPVEMRGDHAFHALDRFTLLAFDRDLKRISLRLENGDRGRKLDHASLLRKLDFQLVAPMLAELLHVFGAIGGGNAGLRDRHVDTVFRCSMGLARGIAWRGGRGAISVRSMPAI